MATNNIGFFVGLLGFKIIKRHSFHFLSFFQLYEIRDSNPYAKNTQSFLAPLLNKEVFTVTASIFLFGF